MNEKTAAFVAANVKKGGPVYVEAYVADRSYEKDGKTVYTTDVVANVFDLLAPAAKEGEAHD